MTSIPVPFVVAMLLAVLVTTHHQRLKETSTGRLFLAILWLSIASVIFIGLRWTLDRVIFLPFAALLSIAGIVLLYLAFKSLGRSGPVLSIERDWIHATPLIGALLVMVTFMPAIEIPLIATKLLYGGLLIHLARQAAETLQFVRLGWFKDTHQALWVSAWFTIFSVLIDIVIMVDFALFEGRHAATLVGAVNLLMLIPLGLACVVAGGDSVTSHTENALEVLEAGIEVDSDGNSDQAPGAREIQAGQSAKSEVNSANIENSDPATDRALLDRLNGLLLGQKLYADTELNLQRLARKAGVPTRSVSRAINAQTGLNMSQWVNNARIDAVCELLSNSDISVGQAMYEVGFTTKSNFNREFRRVTGSSPSAWRLQQS